MARWRMCGLQNRKVTATRTRSGTASWLSQLSQLTGHACCSQVKATAISVIAGTDVDCGNQYSTEFGAAVQAGELTEDAIDLALTRLTKAWLRLGLFDPKADQPYFQLGGDVIDSPAHQALALEAAQQAIVLLKNEGNVLPLKAGGKVAVVGPHFNATDVMISNYHGSRCPGKKNNFDCIPTVRFALRKC